MWGLVRELMEVVERVDRGLDSETGSPRLWPPEIDRNFKNIIHAELT